MPISSPPAANSSIGGIGVYISPKDGDAIVRDPQIARILPINATSTTLHWFADPGQMRRLKGFVYSEANLASLEAAVAAGTTVNVTVAGVSKGNFVIVALSASRHNALNYTDTWHAFQCEVIQQ